MKSTCSPESLLDVSTKILCSMIEGNGIDLNLSHRDSEARAQSAVEQAAMLISMCSGEEEETETTSSSTAEVDLAKLEYEVRAVLDNCGTMTMWVREGGGDLNLAMSLAVTVSKIHGLACKYVDLIKHGEE